LVKGATRSARLAGVWKNAHIRSIQGVAIRPGFPMPVWHVSDGKCLLIMVETEYRRYAKCSDIALCLKSFSALSPSCSERSMKKRLALRPVLARMCRGAPWFAPCCVLRLPRTITVPMGSPTKRRVAGLGRGAHERRYVPR
jgi:hypothetical protein